MLVLITYDVNVQTAEGQRRLRKVAKLCKKYGQRVQCSVFECDIDPAQLCLLKQQLCGIINEQKDSLRFYNLGKNYQNRIEHYGVKESYDPEGVLLV
ncbi:MAG: CRISPR-associated endonuclease Cas2 [bacterium]|nr:CRISPR-associated endonuclease Cas2 [bacterium]